MEEHWGNPSSLYTLGQEANELLQSARERIAGCIGAAAREIYFTSGGSEADNERNAIAIRYEMMFTSRTTSIYGVGSCVFAPLFAWMTEPSIQALLQSIFFVSCKFCRMTW